MLDYNLKTISKVEKDKLLSFYKIVFKDRYKILFANHEWFYRLKDTNCEPIVLTIEDKVIGQLGTIPIKVKINNKVKTASWYVDFVILPEFQGKGIGYKLAKEGMKKTDIQIAFCNEQALKVYKGLNWSINTSTKRLARPINPIKWLPFLNNSNSKIFKNLYNFSINRKLKDLSLIKPYAFKKNSKSLLESFLKRKVVEFNSFKFLRDEEWFNWRFVEFPFSENLLVFESNGNYIIGHSIRLKNIKRLHVIFHYYLNTSEEEKIYFLIFKWAVENDFDLIWSCSVNQNLIEKLKTIFPKNLIKSMKIASYSSDEEAVKLMNKNFQNIQASDSDIDTLYLRNN